MQILGEAAENNGVTSGVQDMIVRTEKIFIEDDVQNDNYIKVRKI